MLGAFSLVLVTLLLCQLWQVLSVSTHIPQHNGTPEQKGAQTLCRPRLALVWRAVGNRAHVLLAHSSPARSGWARLAGGGTKHPPWNFLLGLFVSGPREGLEGGGRCWL